MKMRGPKRHSSCGQIIAHTTHSTSHQLLKKAKGQARGCGVAVRFCINAGRIDDRLLVRGRNVGYKRQDCKAKQ
jgi:hypothetical protein